ncbi:hypothetical protein TNCV_100961 [Trichonephila clavipes]|nr:hypothetical protein TNCV_100961 [Trichonephila clavipes]
MPICQVLDGTSTIRKNPDIVQLWKRLNGVQSLKNCNKLGTKYRARVRIFSLDFNFLVPKTNINAPARTVTTKLTAVRVHMNSVLGEVNMKVNRQCSRSLTIEAASYPIHEQEV